MMPVLVLLFILAAILFLSTSISALATLFLSLTGILAVGTFGFWMLIALEAGFILYCLDNGEDDSVWAGWSTLSVLLTLVILQQATSLKPLTWLYYHPVTALVYFAVYVGVGLTWSVGKWWFFNTGRERKVSLLRQKFLKENNLPGPDVPAAMLVAWSEYFARNHYRAKLKNVGELGSVKPDAAGYRDRLIGWAAFWPFSLAWTLINDPLVRFFNRLYDLMQNVYKRISDHVFHGLDTELEQLRAKQAEEEEKKNQNTRRRRDY